MSGPDNAGMDGGQKEQPPHALTATSADALPDDGVTLGDGPAGPVPTVPEATAPSGLDVPPACLPERISLPPPRPRSEVPLTIEMPTGGNSLGSLPRLVSPKMRLQPTRTKHRCRSCKTRRLRVGRRARQKPRRWAQSQPACSPPSALSHQRRLRRMSTPPPLHIASSWWGREFL